MILTVTLNLALDVTYEVPRVDWNGVNRVGTVHRRAGGKGVNVARVLTALGHNALITGLAGGPTGHAIASDLASASLPHTLTPVATDSRTTLVITEPPTPSPTTHPDEPSHTRPTTRAHEPGRTALFNEPGPQVTPGELAEFTRRYEELLAGADAVVLAGSLPPGVPADCYATLAALAAARGVPAVVDADGEPLRHAAAGRPAVVKPNADELARAVPGGTLTEAAEALRERGAGAVVVSMGADGLLAVTGEGTFRARMPYTVPGNPTGAGDALVAGLALGLLERTPWPDTLRRAAALGAAAVATPVAGEIDQDVYAAVHHRITVS